MWRDDHAGLSGRDFDGELGGSGGDRHPALTPGKRTLTSGIPVAGPPARASTRSIDEQWQIATAAVTGQPSPLPHRERMEQAFGRSFADVVAFRDDQASAALAAGGARAVALDHRVAFRDPDPAPELVAHELAHVVQHDAAGDPGDQAGRETEAAQVAGPAAAGHHVVVSRTGDRSRPQFDDLIELDPRQVPMMADRRDQYWIHWPTEIAPAPPPGGMLVDWQPRFPDRAPTELEPSEDPGMLRLREEFLTAFRDSALELATAWNAVAPLHNQHELTHERHRDELRAVHHFVITRAQGNTESLANMQPAGTEGQAGRNRISVGDLFDNTEVAGLRVSTGTELRLDPQADRGIDRAAGRVDAELMDLDHADGQLAAGVIAVHRAAADLGAAERHARAAVLGARIRSAGRERDRARDRVAAVESSIAEQKEEMKHLLGLAKDVASVVAFAAAPAAQGGQRASSLAGTGASVAGNSTIGAVAEHLIDLSMADALAEVKRDLADASTRLRGLVDEQDAVRIDATTRAVQAAVLALDQARASIPSLLADRRRAHERLATAAARASGAPPGSRGRDQIRGAIAALPIVDTMVSRTRAAREAARLPAFTAVAGQGLGMCHAHRLPCATEFVRHVAWMRYLQALYADRSAFWAARRESLGAVIERLRADGG